MRGDDPFQQRLSSSEIEAIAVEALRAGMLAEAPSALFHHLPLMRARLAALSVAFPSGTLHTIAIKANPVVAILRQLVAERAGLEAASLEEVELALAAGCPAEHIVYDSPAKTPLDIRRALELGVYVNVDSFAELARVSEQRKDISSRSRIGLRINPLVAGGTIAQTSVGTASVRFGVPLSDRAAILDAFAQHAWLTGLHVHVGSQGCSLALLAEAASRIEALRREIDQRCGPRISHIDIGGGLPTSYRSDQRPPTPSEYVAQLRAAAPSLFDGKVQLVTEFGRAIHANCGVALSRVEYADAGTAVIHLGADFLLRPVYRPEDWAHEFVVLDSAGRLKTGAQQPVTLRGPLCFAGDVLARERMLPAIAPGDVIAILDVGAYTLSMWSRHCSRGMPDVVGYDPRQAPALIPLRRRERLEDVVRFWS